MTRRMTTETIKAHIDRTFRTSGEPYIWGREVLVNGHEAGATQFCFGVEEQSAAQGRFRFVCVDDGCGMDPEQLEHDFLTWGGSSKDVGGVHDNFGIGAKTMLLPWNTLGILIVTRTADMDEPVMARLWYDEEVRDYGLYEFEVPDDGGGYLVKETVVTAGWVDELGIDAAQLLPHDTGTALLLLGTPDQPDSVHGATSHGESSGTGLAATLARRFDRMPGDMDVTVEWLAGEPGDWDSDKIDHRPIKGLTDSATRVRHGEPEPATGEVELTDGTRALWTLRAPETGPTWSVTGVRGTVRGCVTVGYERPDGDAVELFDRKTHQSTYAAMGVRYSAVAEHLYVLFLPPLHDEDAGTPGVVMDSGRATLKWIDADGATGPLPDDSWKAEFASRLPQEIVDALAAHRRTGENDVAPAELERLEADFRARWKGHPPVTEDDGPDTVDPDLPVAGDGGSATTTGARPAGGGATRRRHRSGASGGPRAARRREGRGGLPKAEWVHTDDFSGEPEHLAFYVSPSSSEPAGIVQLHVDHPVIVEEVAHYADQYPAHLHDDVEEIVLGAYLTEAVATIAHVQMLRGSLGLGVDRWEAWRSADALTVSLLGLWTIEARIDRRLAGLGVRRL